MYLLFIFPVLSLRYMCLLYSKALFIDNDRPHLRHDLLDNCLRHDEPASQSQNTVGPTIDEAKYQIVPLHANFSQPHF